jgi:hypothetical protein
MIVVGEKTEKEPEKEHSEAAGALRDGWQLCSEVKEDILTKSQGWMYQVISTREIQVYKASTETLQTNRRGKLTGKRICRIGCSSLVRAMEVTGL